MSSISNVRRSLGLPINEEVIPAFAWPGGYQLYYVCRDGGVLCPDCVNKEIDLISSALEDDFDKQWRVIGTDVNYEDNDLTCDHCNGLIPASYGDDHADSSNALAEMD